MTGCGAAHGARGSPRDTAAPRAAETARALQPCCGFADRQKDTCKGCAAPIRTLWTQSKTLCSRSERRSVNRTPRAARGADQTPGRAAQTAAGEQIAPGSEPNPLHDIRNDRPRITPGGFSLFSWTRCGAGRSLSPRGDTVNPSLQKRIARKCEPEDTKRAIFAISDQKTAPKEPKCAILKSELRLITVWCNSGTHKLFMKM